MAFDMRNKKYREKYLALLKDIESDDELPDQYVEKAETPAYLNNYRFDTIQFNWIYKYLAKNTGELQSSTETVVDDCFSGNNGNFRSKGILKHQDVHCLRSVAACASSNTLVWFVKFLMKKDAHSHYNFLRSCLVNNTVPKYALPTHNECEEPLTDCSRYKIVIKQKKKCTCLNDRL